MIDHPVAARWPAADPAAIQLYSLPTPNGIKVSAMLEETGFAYEPHRVDIGRGDQFSDAFTALNPNQKIPAIIDPDGPDGAPLALSESGAILIYLADKSGRFLSADPAERLETLQWLMWQMGGIGPMLGQFGFFNSFGGKDWEDKRPLGRYADESARLLKVLDDRLDGRAFMMGENYTIADLATWPWVVAMEQYHHAYDRFGVTRSRNLMGWIERTSERPASQRARNIPAIS